MAICLGFKYRAASVGLGRLLGAWGWVPPLSQRSPKLQRQGDGLYGHQKALPVAGVGDCMTQGQRLLESMAAVALIG